MPLKIILKIPQGGVGEAFKQRTDQFLLQIQTYEMWDFMAYMQEVATCLAGVEGRLARELSSGE